MVGPQRGDWQWAASGVNGGETLRRTPSAVAGWLAQGRTRDVRAGITPRESLKGQELACWPLGHRKPSLRVFGKASCLLAQSSWYQKQRLSKRHERVAGSKVGQEGEEAWHSTGPPALHDKYVCSLNVDDHCTRS